MPDRGPDDPLALAVCICTRNRPAELAETLKSIAASTQPVRQVVVSDDGTDPGTPAVCREAGIPVLYAEGPRRGLGPNRNAALGHVTEPYVLFLDDDCLLHPAFVATATAAMHEQEARLGHGRVVLTGSETNKGKTVVAHDQSFLGFQHRPYAPGDTMHSIVINATVFPSDLFGLERFDENLVYGYDEVDLASRAVAGGFHVIQMDGAPNDHRPSPKSRDDYMHNTAASRLYVTFKRYAWTEGRPLKAAGFALAASGHEVAAGARRDGVAGARSGLRTVRRAAAFVWAHRQSA